MTTTPPTVVGQPARATVTFVDANNAPYDPTTVVLSAISPFGNATPYTVGVDASATRTSQGNYTLAFTPTTDGNWLVIGDAYDVTGNQIGAGISAALYVGPRRGGTAQAQAAQAIVEQYIGRPLRLVTETVELYSGADGILELPRRPVVSVASVLGSLGVVAGLEVSEGFAIGGLGYSEDTPSTVPVEPLPTADGFGRIADPNVLGFNWYRVTYTHGWADPDVPAIIRTVLAAVEARLTANPDAVATERIGAGYSVSYGEVAAAWLTKDEKEALAQYRPRRVGTLTTSTPLGGLP